MEVHSPASFPVKDIHEVVLTLATVTRPFMPSELEEHATQTPPVGRQAEHTM
jgi:hypothetical protein